MPNFASLRALLARPRCRRLLRVAGVVALAVYFLLAFTVLVLRYSILPRITDYREDIERSLSETAHLPVSIRALEAHWQGLWPNLTIHGLEIRDAQGRPALAFDNVEADVAWSSLWHLGLRLARLEMIAPSLDVRRDAGGRLFVAGLEVDTGNQDPGVSEWLLAQDRIVIRDASVTWHDELRGAPALSLRHLNIDLRNSGDRHRFGLTATPPRELAARLDLRGDITGEELARPETWSGEAYAELDYADLAGWRAWVDYPLELPRGMGGLRLWLGFGQKTLESFTADVRLANVQLRLGRDLPMLDLERLEGRLTARSAPEAMEIHSKRLALATRDGIRVDPTDFSLRWQPPTDNRPGQGEMSADNLDLTALAALAGFLPMAADVREKLVAYGPRGLLRDFRLTWRGDAGSLAGYSLKARFDDLGLNPQGVLPGFKGLDGRIEGDEKGGTLELATRDASIDLPAVFSEPRLVLATLDANVIWKMVGGAAEVNIKRAVFRNADAEGSASGSYRGDGKTAGTIDLTARVTRSAGDAVWRYMPLVVSKDARDWLRQSIVGGSATASLRLKGDLDRFPFEDGSGVFEVKGPFEGASLRYAPGWPAFEEVSGELEFVGARMVIRARKARLWDVSLADVKAEVPRLGVAEPMMTITGTARGPTADFLRFIEASPVGEHIDHFTEGMKATGPGELRLKLEMPMRNAAATQVDGNYRFVGDTLTPDPDMPPLADVNGELHFTADRLEGRKIRATALGAPLLVDVATTPEGKVAVKAAGTMTVRGLRQQFGHPLFDHLSGGASWNAVVQVKGRNAEVRFESPLTGISSSLPEPFNKTATDTMPFVFERGAAAVRPETTRGRRPVIDAAVRDQVMVSLGNALRVQLIRRHDNGNVTVERGVVDVGRTEVRLPERGVLLAVQMRRLDTDFWRRLGGGSSDAPFSPSQVDVRADELVVFGRTVNAFRLTGSADGNVWKMDLKSREASGRLEWNGDGAGRISGRMAQLAIPESQGGGADAEASRGPAEDLPAIDLAVDHLLLKGKDLGELKLAAENKDKAWNAKFELKNEDATFEGSGRWRQTQLASETRLDFKLNARSIEKALLRYGYLDAMKGGSANLSGSLGWNGPPQAVDYPTLSGNLKLEARDGQFKKMDPGVGRLLGILSLQSLPRRLTLDFRDIFSEGFAFDSIGGQFAVNRGVLDTKDLQIQGPAARILMKGSVNLPQESQNLRVRVQPALGETLATGVLLIHPVAGAITWLADKLLKDPLGQIFAYEYAVTGSWADPKVEKVAMGQDAKPGTATP